MENPEASENGDVEAKTEEEEKKEESEEQKEEAKEEEKKEEDDNEEKKPESKEEEVKQEETEETKDTEVKSEEVKESPAKPKEEASPKKITKPSKTVEVEEYLVKFKNFSYLHCQWLTEEELSRGDKRVSQKIKRYQQKKEKSANVLDFCDDEPFNPDYVEVDRVLDSSVHTDPDTNVSFMSLLSPLFCNKPCSEPPL